MRHNKMERWKLHGHISRNDYGNAIIGRYDGCFEEGVWCMVPAKVARYKRGQQWWKGERVRIIHGLNINQKNSYTCCKNLEVIKNLSTTRMLLGG